MKIDMIQFLLAESSIIYLQFFFYNLAMELAHLLYCYVLTTYDITNDSMSILSLSAILYLPII